MAKSRMGIVHRVNSLSNENVSSEYAATVPSSDPTRNVLFYAVSSAVFFILHERFCFLTEAAMAVLFSWQSSILVGSPSDPVV